jgi:hypothetical protein
LSSISVLTEGRRNFLSFQGAELLALGPSGRALRHGSSAKLILSGEARSLRQSLFSQAELVFVGKVWSPKLSSFRRQSFIFTAESLLSRLSLFFPAKLDFRGVSLLSQNVPAVKAPKQVKPANQG